MVTARSPHGYHPYNFKSFFLSSVVLSPFLRSCRVLLVDTLLIFPFSLILILFYMAYKNGLP